MFEICDATVSALKFISGECTNICRLCFGGADGGASIDETRLLQCAFFDDSITFTDMFQELGVPFDPDLPLMLCAYCSDSAINSFLFYKMCQHSQNLWHESMKKLDNALDSSDTLAPTVKTAYVMVKDNSAILTSKTTHQRNKESALKKIRSILTAKINNRKVKKPMVMCEECGQKFSFKSVLLKHMRLHSNVKHSCTHCAKSFPSMTQVQDHIERIHEPKVIECTKCDKMFSTIRLLKKHDMVQHQAVRCKQCSLQFPSRMDLQHHLSNHEQKKCPSCKKEFKNKYRFKLHLKTCGSIKSHGLNYFCDICNKGYVGKNGLKSHIATSHGFGKVYTCNWCSKPFDATSKLKNHIVKHTRERNFNCDQCGGQFVTHAALVYHIRIHTGERPFPCDLCSERFLSASRRMQHKRRKHFGPQRECPVCHRRFVTPNELSKHVARHKNPHSKLYVEDNTNHNYFVFE